MKVCNEFHISQFAFDWLPTTGDTFRSYEYRGRSRAGVTSIKSSFSNSFLCGNEKTVHQENKTRHDTVNTYFIGAEVV